MTLNFFENKKHIYQFKPTQELFAIATAMFKDAWNQQSHHMAEMLKVAKQNIQMIEKQIGFLVDRIIEASLPAVIGKYETRIAELEKEKLLLQETLHIQAKPHGRFGYASLAGEELFKLTLAFIANPQVLWHSGRIEHKRAVLRMAFADRIIYCRETGLHPSGLRKLNTKNIFAIPYVSVFSRAKYKNGGR